MLNEWGQKQRLTAVGLYLYYILEKAKLLG